MVFRSGPSPSRRALRSRWALPRTLFSLPALSLLAFGACGEPVNEPQTTLVNAAVSAKTAKPAKPDGEELFNTAFAATNGRSCATCHVPGEHFGLTPGHVAATLAANPADPLFNRLDADDPNAAVPTYEHLKKGLVRVVLTLPDNMDTLDPFFGFVNTPPDRKIAVWRAVPTVENTAITAPYQYDGRKGTLQEQAQAAVTAHSEGGTVAQGDLDAIAAFQQSQFTSNRAKFVAKKLAQGVPVEQIDRPELKMDELTPAQKRGLALYNATCEACHGGATTNRIVNREVHDFAIPELKPDGSGNVLFDTSVTPPVPVRANMPTNEFLNIGIANLTAFGQFGFPGIFTSNVQMPAYRFRFYTDATKTVVRADLPPLPQFDPATFLPLVDENGAPIVGPNFIPQFFSTDPGRAAITGDPHDFEAFDMPPLRGLANTAPYFHDNAAETLRDLVNIYSRFIVQFFPMLNRPLVNPPETPFTGPESFTPQEKDDLISFLEIL
jgi:cytochrome c peroxidase